MGDTLKNLEHVYKQWENRKGGGRPTGNSYDSTVASGKQVWRKKYGENIGPAPQRRTRKYKPNSFQPLSRSSLLGDFKTQPMVRPENDIYKRPFMGRCCNCLQISRNTFYSDNVMMAGTMNILRPSASGEGKNGFFSGMFSHIAFVMKRDVNHRYPDVSEAVLHSERVLDTIDEEIAKNTEDPLDTDDNYYNKMSKKCKKRVKRLIINMKAAISRKLIRFTGWFLLKLFGRLLTSIVVNRGQMQMLKEASQKHKHMPLVFLPLHRSHLDYIILTLVLFCSDISAPYVAAGDNLRIPFFSSLLRRLGGFFIRRKLDPHAGQKDILYRAVLHSYMSELLREGQYMEFFIEGGRSRTGKACFPKAGLMSVIVDAQIEGIVPDVYIVPLSISYERILDGNFVNEQMGQKKKKETFWGAVKAIWNLLHSNFGNVRVDVCQPFSLQEYMEVAQNFPGMRKRQTLEHNTSNSSNDESNMGPGQMKMSGSCASLYGTDVVREEQRMMVQNLAEHVVYNSVNATAIMCTHLLAFVLLTIHRKGAKLSEITKTFDWLKEEITLKGRDVGFTGDNRDVILYAVDVLGENLVTVMQSDSSENEEDDLMIKPVQTLPYVHELAYYSNVVSSVFLMESIAAAAAVAACDENLMKNHPQPVKLSKNKLMEKIKELHLLLNFEFMFAPTCESAEYRVLDGIDNLSVKGVFFKEEENVYSTTEEQRAGKRMASLVSWDDDDSDDEVTVDEILMTDVDSEEFKSYVPFLLNVLGPIVETYWVAACNLLVLLDTDMTEEEFIRGILKKTQKRVYDDIATYTESASFETIKTALRSFQHQKVLEIYYLNDIRMVSLCDSYISNEKINNFVDKVESFRC